MSEIKVEKIEVETIPSLTDRALNCHPSRLRLEACIRGGALCGSSFISDGVRLRH